MERLGVHGAWRDLIASLNGTAMLVALPVCATAASYRPRDPRPPTRRCQTRASDLTIGSATARRE
jgi:hypothetical protein